MLNFLLKSIKVTKIISIFFVGIFFLNISFSFAQTEENNWYFQVKNKVTGEIVTSSPFTKEKCESLEQEARDKYLTPDSGFEIYKSCYQNPLQQVNPVENSNSISLPSVQNNESDSGSITFSGLENPISTNTFDEFITRVMDIVLMIGIPIIALMIIYSGFLFVMARGNDKKITEAKETFLYTVIGAAILLGATLISKVISSTINALKVGL